MSSPRNRKVASFISAHRDWSCVCGRGVSGPVFRCVTNGFTIAELPAARKRKSTAFTLVELIVVLVVIAIAAAIVVPYAVGTSSLEAASAARMIMSDLEYAQNQAIVTQSSVAVTFSVGGNSYTVSNESGTLIHPITKQAYVVDFDTSRSYDSVSVSSADFGGTSAVTFDVLGAPDNDGKVVVVAGPHTYTVTVAPISGRVTVAEGN